MGAHLPFRGLVGRSVRHVAVLEHWLALVGWHARSSSGPATAGSGGCPSSSFAAFTSSPTTRGSSSCPSAPRRTSLRGSEPSPALGRLPRNAWPSNSDRRNLRRSGPLHRRVLPGGELAGAGPHPRFARKPARPRPGSPTQTEGGPGLPAARARATVRLTIKVVDRPSSKPVGVMVCPISAARAGGAIRWPLAIAVAANAGVRPQSAVLPSVDPASFVPGGRSQPPSGALHRGRPRPRSSRFSPTWTPIARGPRSRSRTDPVAIDGSGRQAPARRRCGAPLWVLGQEAVEDKSNEIPAVRTGHRARPHRPRRDPRRDAHQPPHRPVLGRAVRRVMHRGQGQLPQLARRVGCTKCAPPSRTRDTVESRSEAAGCSTSPSTATAPPCLIVRSPFASSASGASSRPARSSTRPYTA